MQRHYFVDKGPSSQSYGFSSSHGWKWQLDHKETWASEELILLSCDVKTLESPLDCKEIKPVNPKGKQFCIVIGRTDAEAEAPILWTPDAKSWLIRKDPDAGRLKVGGTGDNRGWDGYMASQTQWTWIWASSGRWWRTGRPRYAAVHGVTKSWTRLSDWTSHSMFKQFH